MGLYELDRLRQPGYEMTDNTKYRILECKNRHLDGPITSTDIKRERNLYRHANSVLDGKAMKLK